MWTVKFGFSKSEVLYNFTGVYHVVISVFSPKFFFVSVFLQRRAERNKCTKEETLRTNGLNFNTVHKINIRKAKRELFAAKIVSRLMWLWQKSYTHYSSLSFLYLTESFWIFIWCTDQTITISASLSLSISLALNVMMRDGYGLHCQNLSLLLHFHLRLSCDAFGSTHRPRHSRIY